MKVKAYLSVYGKVIETGQWEYLQFFDMFVNGSVDDNRFTKAVEFAKTFLNNSKYEEIKIKDHQFTRENGYFQVYGDTDIWIIRTKYHFANIIKQKVENGWN